MDKNFKSLHAYFCSKHDKSHMLWICFEFQDSVLAFQSWGGCRVKTWFSSKTIQTNTPLLPDSLPHLSPPQRPAGVSRLTTPAQVFFLSFSAVVFVCFLLTVKQRCHDEQSRSQHFAGSLRSRCR